MIILVTGADGFVGKNLCAALKNIMLGNDRRFDDVKIDEIIGYDVKSNPQTLERVCEKADFVFHLAGVNRSENESAFREGNVIFTERLIGLLEKYKNNCPVMYSSSVMAGENTAYGKTKEEAENVILRHAAKTGAAVYIYRYENIFGKWCRPDYNSVVATFCHRLARGLQITVNDRERELRLCYIDDVVDDLIRLLSKKYIHTAGYCKVETQYSLTVGGLAGLMLKISGNDLCEDLPQCGENTLYSKLFSTYLSYLPPEKAVLSYREYQDARGSFTELFRTEKNGQVSLNKINPGARKGMHWHSKKWEIFVALRGNGVVKQRKINETEVFEYTLSEDKTEGVCVLPGYVHSIENSSETEELAVLIYASEKFDKENPDTFTEDV